MIEHHFVAVRNICAWPNLTQLADGTILAAVFNQPSHGGLPGDADCYASVDGGLTWERRATIAPRPTPESNRMNLAAGLASNGDVLVVCSGWRNPGVCDDLHPTAVFRSSDAGRTWTETGLFPEAPGGGHCVPFGDVVPGADGSLRVIAYRGKPHTAYMFASADDGHTWGEGHVIAEGINECAPIHLGDGRWFIAARTFEHEHLHAVRSDDDGATWQDAGALTKEGEIPAHVLRLADGRLAITFGDRRHERLGVTGGLSVDEAATWQTPFRLVEIPPTDCGYPSSVQRPDGMVVTAYYANGSPLYDGYYMGVVIWRPPAPDQNTENKQ